MSKSQILCLNSMCRKGTSLLYQLLYQLADQNYFLVRISIFISSYKCCLRYLVYFRSKIYKTYSMYHKLIDDNFNNLNLNEAAK